MFKYMKITQQKQKNIFILLYYVVNICSFDGKIKPNQHLTNEEE